MGTIIGTTDDRTKRPARCRGAQRLARIAGALHMHGAEAQARVLLDNLRLSGGLGKIAICANCADGRSRVYVQAFTTGNMPATLESIELMIGRAPGATLPQSPTITIHKESAKDSARVATLTGPDIDGYNTRFRTYAAPAETTLLADTKYYVKIRGGDVSAYRTTRRDFAERAPGWGLPEGGESRVADPGVLGEHRVDIHRNQQTFTLDIALIDDDSM